MEDKLKQLFNENIPLEVLRKIEVHRKLDEDGLLILINEAKDANFHGHNWGNYVIRNLEEVVARFLLYQELPDYVIEEKQEIKELKKEEIVLSNKLKAHQDKIRHLEANLNRSLRQLEQERFENNE